MVLPGFRSFYGLVAKTSLLGGSVLAICLHLFSTPFWWRARPAYSRELAGELQRAAGAADRIAQLLATDETLERTGIAQKVDW